MIISRDQLCPLAGDSRGGGGGTCVVLGGVCVVPGTVGASADTAGVSASLSSASIRSRARTTFD